LEILTELTFVNFFIIEGEGCFSWNAKDARAKIGKKREVPFYF